MSKMPTTNDKYVGIEIECICRVDEYKVMNVLQKHNLLDYVEVAEDGSIDADETCTTCDGSGYEDDEDADDTIDCSACGGSGSINDLYTYEFKVLVKQKDTKIVLNRLQMALRDMQATVNDSCGLHVHIDMRNRKFTDGVSKLLNMQSMMLRSVPKTRRNNEYCQPVLDGEFTDLYNIPKYHTIHTEACMEEFNTVEVRVHEGTVDCSAIYKWIKFLISTVDGNFATGKVRTLRALPVRIQKYLKERIASNA